MKSVGDLNYGNINIDFMIINSNIMFKLIP